ncbi:hypothetical protein NC652_004222 [Populus alba x Populus x berolinensis]|nr:hypothetical protein NC652_004222 [Populus alba x Populus x berolinensis]
MYFTLYGDRIVPDHTTCNLQPDDVDLGLLVFTNNRFPKQCSDDNAQASTWIYECKHEMLRNIQKTFCRLQLCDCSSVACSVSSRYKQTSMDLQAVKFELKLEKFGRFNLRSENMTKALQPYIFRVKRFLLNELYIIMRAYQQIYSCYCKKYKAIHILDVHFEA